MPPSEPSSIVELKDGQVVRVRPICPDDKDLLRRGFVHLGPESRYYRFLTAKRELSEHDLHYLTEVDGYDHFALGAAIVDADGSEEPVGVARFVRDARDRSVAEPAVAVIDSMQGKGLGKALLRRLTSAARERGITTFRSLIRADNLAVRNLLDEAGTHTRIIESRNGLLLVEMSLLADESAPGRSSPAEVLLAHAADERVEVHATQPRAALANARKLLAAEKV